MKQNIQRLLFLSAVAYSLYAADDPRRVASRVDNPRAGLACTPAHTARLTLNEAARAALCNDPETAGAYAASLAQAWEMGVLKAGELPSLDLTLSLTRGNQRNDAASTEVKNQAATLSLSYLLYDGGATRARIDAGNALLDAALASQNQSVHTLLLSVVQKYNAALSAQATLEALKEAEALARQSVESAMAGYRTGTLPKADLLQAQTSLAQATLSRVKGEGSANVANAALASLMGLSPQTPLVLVAAEEFDGIADAARVEDLMQKAREARPELAATMAQLNAAQASLKAAEASGGPTLSLSGNLGYSDTDAVTGAVKSATAGVVLSIPLFSGYESSYRIQAAKEAHHTKELQRDKVMRAVLLDVVQAYLDLRSKAEALKAGRALVASADESEKMARGRYKAGAGTMIDMLTAQNALTQARLQYTQALYDWRSAKAALATAIGENAITLQGGRR